MSNYIKLIIFQMYYYFTNRTLKYEPGIFFFRIRYSEIETLICKILYTKFWYISFYISIFYLINFGDFIYIVLMSSLYGVSRINRQGFKINFFFNRIGSPNLFQVVNGSKFVFVRAYLINKDIHVRRGRPRFIGSGLWSNTF